MLNRVDITPQTQGAQKSAARPAAPQGRFASQRVVKMPSQAQLLQDMQEEISFAHSEKTEKKNIEEYECEDAHQNLYFYLVEKIQEAYPPEDKNYESKKESFAKALFSEPQQSEEQIENALHGLTEDAGEAFALLQDMLKTPPEGMDAKTLASLKATEGNYAEKHGARILAAINTAPLARETGAAEGIQTSELQARYQQIVEDYTGILPALAQLTAKNGVEKFEESARFIMQATERDLVAQRASRNPERLKRILAEFQGLKVFNTLREWSAHIFGRFGKHSRQALPFDKNTLFSRAVQFLAHPENFQGLLQKDIQKLSPRDQVLFLQEVRNAVRTMPDYLFQAPEEQKSRILFPLQSRIDHLVFEEEA